MFKARLAALVLGLVGVDAYAFSAQSDQKPTTSRSFCRRLAAIQTLLLAMRAKMVGLASCDGAQTVADRSRNEQP